jgi:NDP-sugar pyrophosphorylase family protein
MIDPNVFFSLEDFEHKDLWQDGQPVWQALYNLNTYFKKSFKIDIEIPQGVFLSRPELISIGEGTIIEPGVYIQGPCIIGKNCNIRHGAYIRGSVVVGDDCSIGHCAELKHCILLNGASATHFVYIGDSIVGNYVNLSAGVKCANLRLDREEIMVNIGGERYNTGLKKFGAIIGDRSQIGCNCVLNPGTFIGKDSLCHPLMNLSGFVPGNAQVSKKGIHILEKLLKL